jgi:hypothetical protein
LLPLNTTMQENNKTFAQHTDKVVAAISLNGAFTTVTSRLIKSRQLTLTTFCMASFQSVAATASTTA